MKSDGTLIFFVFFFGDYGGNGGSYLGSLLHLQSAFLMEVLSLETFRSVKDHCQTAIDAQSNTKEFETKGTGPWELAKVAQEA